MGCVCLGLSNGKVVAEGYVDGLLAGTGGSPVAELRHRATIEKQELCLKFFKGIHVDAIHFCRPRLKAGGSQGTDEGTRTESAS